MESARNSFMANADYLIIVLILMTKVKSSLAINLRT